MNPTLALLLSSAYDGSLAPAHRADLDKSGLNDATIEAHYIRAVPPDLIRPLLGFDVDDLVSACLFPFRSPAGGFLDYVFLKRFPSGRDRYGRTSKYLTRQGATPRLYFTQPHLATICDSDQPLWLVEGVKQALAVAQAGLPAVGFTGIEAWHAAGRHDLCPDFTSIPLKGRLVELLPDGDWQANPNVARGVHRLGTALLFAGAKPRLRVLPRTLEPS